MAARVFVVTCLLVSAALASTVSAADFDAREAQFYASLCAISYCSLSDIAAWNCAACNSSYTPRFVYAVPQTQQTAYVLDNGQDTTIVVFKGTEPLSWYLFDDHENDPSSFGLTHSVTRLF